MSDDYTIVTEESVTQVVTDPDSDSDIVINDTSSTVTTSDTSMQTVSVVEDTTVLNTETQTQVLSDTSVGPQGPAGDTQVNVYYQADDPGSTGEAYVWVQDLGGGAFTVWADDGVT